MIKNEDMVSVSFSME